MIYFTGTTHWQNLARLAKGLFVAMCFNGVAFGDVIIPSNDISEEREDILRNFNITTDYMDHYRPWCIALSGGYDHFDNAYNSDGNTGVGRISVGYAMWNRPRVSFGLEVGVQTGNNMRLPMSYSSQLRTSLINTTIKPIVDLLGTVKFFFNDDRNIFALLKGGMAYRYWQISSASISSDMQLAGELQAGLGYGVSSRLNIIAYYQGIYSGSVSYSVNQRARTASLSGIPMQNGAFLGLEFLI